jgi:hypothetical protein
MPHQIGCKHCKGVSQKQFGKKNQYCIYQSCIGKAESFIGAGVYCPQKKAECYVNSGGVGMTDTINRAELTGIATHTHTHIYTHTYTHKHTHTHINKHTGLRHRTSA